MGEQRARIQHVLAEQIFPLVGQVPSGETWPVPADASAIRGPGWRGWSPRCNLPSRNAESRIPASSPARRFRCRSAPTASRRGDRSPPTARVSRLHRRRRRNSPRRSACRPAATWYRSATARTATRGARFAYPESGRRTPCSRWHRPGRPAGSPEEPQSPQRQRGSFLARHPAVLDADRVARQRETDDRDAARRAGARGIGDQSVFGVPVVAEIGERAALQAVEQRIVGQRGKDVHRV